MLHRYSCWLDRTFGSINPYNLVDYHPLPQENNGSCTLPKFATRHWSEDDNPNNTPVASFQIVTWRVWPKDLSNVCQIVIIAVMLCPITKKKLVQVSKKNNSLAIGGLVPALPQITAQRSRWNLPTEPKTGTLCSGGMYFQEETIKSQNWIESELIEVATIPTQHQLLLGAWQLPSYECRSRLGDDAVSIAQTAKQASPSNSLPVSVEF